MEVGSRSELASLRIIFSYGWPMRCHIVKMHYRLWGICRKQLECFFTEVTAVELFPGWQPIEKGTRTIFADDCSAIETTTRHQSRYRGSRLSVGFQAPGGTVPRVRLASAAAGQLTCRNPTK